MAPLLKNLSVPFAFAGGLLKRNKKSKPLCLAAFQVVPDILAGRENNVELRRLSYRLEDYSYSSDRHNKRRREERTGRKRETPVSLHSSATRTQESWWHAGVSQPLALGLPPGSRRTCGQQAVLTSHPFSFTRWLSLSW